MNCKNCGNTFGGNFCNNCGQKAETHRFTFKHAVHNLFHTFTHLDRGFIFLAKELFRHPGIVAKEYIHGKRKKYFSPFQYMFILVAVATFLSVKYSLMGPKADNVLVTQSGAQSFGLQYNAFIYSYFNVIQLISVPVLAFFSWLFFRKSGYNYSENLVLNTFLGGQRTLMYILLSPFLFFFNRYWYVTIGIYYLGWLVYYGWAFVQFFDEKKQAVIIKYIVSVFLFIPAAQALSLTIFYLFFYHK